MTEIEQALRKLLAETELALVAANKRVEKQKEEIEMRVEYYEQKIEMMVRTQKSNAESIRERAANICKDKAEWASKRVDVSVAYMSACEDCEDSIRKMEI